MTPNENSRFLVVKERHQKKLPDFALHIIFDSLTIDEMFLMSKVCEHWNQWFYNYLQTEFFVKKSLAIRLSVNQLPEVYRKCLKVNELHDSHCTDVDHRSGDGLFVQNLQNCKDSDSPLSIILENCTELQSLDLRGLTLDLNFLTKINKCCPELECLFLNSVKLNSKAFYYLHKKIVPKLIHLTIDNLFEVTDWDKQDSVWDQLIRRTERLTDLKLDIFPVESQFDSSSLSQLGPDLVFLHLRHYSKSDQKNAIKLKHIIKNLSQGLGRHIRFLRFYSEEEYDGNECNDTNTEFNRFTNLNALNVSLKHKKQFQWMYETVCEATQLDGLTLDLNNMTDSHQVLDLFLKSEMIANINRLKLENIVLKEEFCDFLKKEFNELLSFHLNDVYFENNNNLIEYLAINECLSELHLEYSRNKTDSGILKCFTGEMLLDYISENNTLKDLALINTEINENKCRQMCERKQIDLYFEN